MRWDRNARRKLAKIVWEKSLELDSEARSVSRGIHVYMRERDSRITLYFKNLGFTRASAEEWTYDPSCHFPPLFKPRRDYLCFAVSSSMVFKVDRERAAKFLVLGLP